MDLIYYKISHSLKEQTLCGTLKWEISVDVHIKMIFLEEIVHLE